MRDFLMPRLKNENKSWRQLHTDAIFVDRIWNESLLCTIEQLQKMQLYTRWSDGKQKDWD
jgi:hypothetical protein